VSFLSKLLGGKVENTPSFQKAVSEAINGALANQLNQALYQFLGRNTPVYPGANQDTYITRGYGYNADVFSIINYIASTAGQVGIKVQRWDGENYIDEDNHELWDYLDRPNPDISLNSFIEANIAYKLITGNNYIYRIGPSEGVNKGRFTELYTMPSQIVEILSGDWSQPVTGYQLKGRWNVSIPKENVLHLKMFNPFADNGEYLYGMSPLRAGLRLLTQSNDSYTAASSAFQNSGAMGLLTGDAPNAEMMLTQEQADDIKRKFKEDYTGAKNIGKTMITAANLKWQQIGLSPVDLNILESQKVSFRQLCNMYKFPSILLNDEARSTYNSWQQAKLALYTDIIIPHVMGLCNDLTRWWAEKWDENIRLYPDLSEVQALQTNKMEQSQWLANAWWISAERKAEIMGEETALSGYYLPMGIIPSDALNIGLEDLSDVDEKLKGIKDYK